jgi:hypothetical protein
MAPKGLINLASSTLDQLSGPMQMLASKFVRFGLRKDGNHMEIHLPFPDYRSTEASVYFEALRELGKAVGER